MKVFDIPLLAGDFLNQYNAYKRSIGFVNLHSLKSFPNNHYSLNACKTMKSVYITLSLETGPKLISTLVFYHQNNHNDISFAVLFHENGPVIKMAAFVFLTSVTGKSTH
jgi:hypothetical protein